MCLLNVHLKINLLYCEEITAGLVVYEWSCKVSSSISNRVYLNTRDHIYIYIYNGMISRDLKSKCHDKAFMSFVLEELSSKGNC